MYLMKIGLLNKRVIYIKVIYPSIPVKYVRERERERALKVCVWEREQAERFILSKIDIYT